LYHNYLLFSPEIVIEPKSIIDETHTPTNIPDNSSTKNQSPIENKRDAMVGIIHSRYSFSEIFDIKVNFVNIQKPSIDGTQMAINIPGCFSTKNHINIENTNEINVAPIKL
tara:strand:+ start:358 stop:690 length:333 start_codon:yes stop_codon:yes gene_type:complete